MTYMLTEEELKKLPSFEKARKWCEKKFQVGKPLIDVLLLANAKHPDYARNLFICLMSRKQWLEIAIWCAEQVLPIWDEKYPDDNRSRVAIECAKKVLENDTKNNRENARIAAYSFAAANSYAAKSSYYYATEAAAHVAYYSAIERGTIYDIAKDASYAYSCNVMSKKVEMQERIIRKAVEILERDQK